MKLAKVSQESTFKTYELWLEFEYLAWCKQAKLGDMFMTSKNMGI